MEEDGEKILGGIKLIKKAETYYLIKFVTGEEAKLFILNDHVFRYQMSPTGKFSDYPTPINPQDSAKIIIKDVKEYGFETYLTTQLDEIKTHYTIKTKDIEIVFDKIRGTTKVHDLRTNKDVLIEVDSLSYNDEKCTQTLHQRSDEYFFGGGMQNGRFSHKGEIILIENTNNWTDGGVSSPCPFYWSSYGYGILRNTWKKGQYDFGEKSEDLVETTHESDDFDAYFFINQEPREILKDYYELTGNPILLPEYAYYEAHLNSFNRDYWIEVTPNICGAILFEDGKYYKRNKPTENNNGILESLNGEKGNYQFSARAMIDRYKKHDMPLGWFFPNDGYGCGYGQSDSLDGDIKNLKTFVDYSNKNGVEVALWTESNLHPVDPGNPKKGDRDLSKEVGVCNVIALKCDVAWIGSGYSFGLSAIEDAFNIFIRETRRGIRPTILTVDGWAGTQRYGGIWSGDQEGGLWEYIRFHIPTYIGSGLSGQPIVGSDMDGIFGGGNKEVNVRDYQWKTFSPLQLNMDGWGKKFKTPFAFDEEATQINRAYLKLKSILMPYNYSIGHEAINGLPMVRAMFLDFPGELPAYTIDSQYQYMWGPYILVAPIYNDVSEMGNSIRDGIYLPDPKQVWIDFFTGEKYQGGKIYNNIITPLWKIPVFVKDGSIIPMTNPNNNPNEIKRDKRIFTLYPNSQTCFNVFEDDGISSSYSAGCFATTNISINGPKSNEVGNLLITIHKTTGSYEKMVKERSTVLQIMASRKIDSIKAVVNGETVQILKSKNLHEFESMDYSYYYDENYILNPYLSSYKNEIKQKFLLIRIGTLDVTTNEIIISIRSYSNANKVFGNAEALNKALSPPADFQIDNNENKLSFITVKWKPICNSDYYEIEKDGVINSNITGNMFSFRDIKSNSKHTFRIRSVLNDSFSEWSKSLDALANKDPFARIICGIKLTSLHNGNNRPVRHTNSVNKDKTASREEKFITLLYDLEKVYEIDNFDYIPSEDAGNGSFLKIQFRHSTDRKQWSNMSKPKIFPHDNLPKKIVLNAPELRFIEIKIVNAVGDFGSEQQVLFYKK